MERSILPQFAEEAFGVSSKTAILSFITAFGITKAITNYYTGRLANNFGRKNLLIIGWILAIPVPFILINAASWSWVIFANLLLGISQGLTWSSTVEMKIELVGEKDRVLAMGLNEFAGYCAVGIVAYLTALVAERYGVTPYPFLHRHFHSYHRVAIDHSIGARHPCICKKRGCLRQYATDAEYIYRNNF